MKLLFKERFLSWLDSYEATVQRKQFKKELNANQNQGDSVMNPGVYIPIIVLWIIIYITLRNNRKVVILRKIIKNRKAGGKTEMKELAERFVGKECLISAFDGHQYDGILKEVTNGAILIKKKERLEAVNLDFVFRIREFPRNKNGKKKSIVLD